MAQDGRGERYVAAVFFLQKTAEWTGTSSQSPMEHVVGAVSKKGVIDIEPMQGTCYDCAMLLNAPRCPESRAARMRPCLTECFGGNCSWSGTVNRCRSFHQRCGPNAHIPLYLDMVCRLMLFDTFPPLCKLAGISSGSGSQTRHVHARFLPSAAAR